MPESSRIDAITYRSESTEQLTEAEFERLLLRSRTLNAARGITGVLVTCERSIVQYLEGPPVSLALTFPAIARSPLHRDIRVLAHVERVSRRFDCWHMGFARFEPPHPLGEEAEEWQATLATLRADPFGNAAFTALLDGWDAIARGHQAAVSAA